VTRPRLLDLFCCQGGAAAGYDRAGFEVVGVDINPQPRYPFEFHQVDVFDYLSGFADDWDAVHASPPCQDHSETRDFGGDHGTGWMLAATLDILRDLPVPWVVENVVGSPLPHQPDLFGSSGLTLCGCMFPELRGLLYEDRLFETSFAIPQPPHVLHQWPQTKMGRRPVPGECMQLTGHFSDAAEGRRRLGTPWMNRDGLAQAIPPAFTEYIGGHLLASLVAADLSEGAA
jgi:DNA (cytosine-5)-methyltransferase 1